MSKLLEKIDRRLRPERPNLLIIDDEESMLLVFSAFFQKRGYRVSTARTLVAAEARLMTESFDIVLLDVTLPDGYGLGFLARIKVMQPNVPVLVFTGIGYDEEFFQEARENGAAGYLSKGLPADQVLMEVRGILKASGKGEAGADGEGNFGRSFFPA